MNGCRRNGSVPPGSRLCHAGGRQRNGVQAVEVGVLRLAARPAEPLAPDVGVVGAVDVHRCEGCRQCGAGTVADLLDGDVCYL